MARKIRSASYWTDSRGRKHDITQISDEYLMNIIAWLQRRKQSLADAAENEGYIMDEILDEHSADLQMLLDEMVRRSENGITIDRADGSEERYNDYD